MKVEQENRFLAILASVQRRRSRSGTSRRMARAKSTLITTASAWCVPEVERKPTARRPSNKISSTSSFREISAPRSSAIPAIARLTAPQPPIG